MREEVILSEWQRTANEKIDIIAQEFVCDEVISIIESSTTFPKILRSRDPDEFLDIPLIQWDTCTANILCLLFRRFKREKVAATQSLLIRICKLSARKIFEKHKLQ